MSQDTPTTPAPTFDALLDELKARCDCDSDLRKCVENWPTDAGSWCNGCLAVALAASLVRREEQPCRCCQMFCSERCECHRATKAAERYQRP